LAPERQWVKADQKIESVAMPAKPSAAMIGACALLSAAAMVAGVYFAGTGRLPLAMLGAALFVVLGGVTFELARRRSA
jgi:hypothetical protein